MAARSYLTYLDGIAPEGLPRLASIEMNLRLHKLKRRKCHHRVIPTVKVYSSKIMDPGYSAESSGYVVGITERAIFL